MNGITYVNGRLVPADQAVLPLNDLGILRGYGVFDYLRTYGRVPFRLREHLLRLESSARQIGLALPWDLEELAEIVFETYAANNHMPDAGIRIVVTGGPSDNAMTPKGQSSLIVMINPVSPYEEAKYRSGCSAITTHIPRILPTVKSTNYIGAIMAMQEADRVDAIEAIYRDDQDRLTEGTRSNLFMVKEGVLVTPATGVLPGITRAAIIEAAAGEFTVAERDVAYADVLAADEVFLTSTTKEVLPIVHVDEHPIGDGTPGPITTRILALFRALVARECATLHL